MRSQGFCFPFPGASFSGLDISQHTPFSVFFPLPSPHLVVMMALSYKFVSPDWCHFIKSVELSPCSLVGSVFPAVWKYLALQCGGPGPYIIALCQCPLLSAFGCVQTFLPYQSVTVAVLACLPFSHVERMKALYSGARSASLLYTSERSILHNLALCMCTIARSFINVHSRVVYTVFFAGCSKFMNAIYMRFSGMLSSTPVCSCILRRSKHELSS